MPTLLERRTIVLCPACYAQNRDHASYCGAGVAGSFDQCGVALAELASLTGDDAARAHHVGEASRIGTELGMQLRIPWPDEPAALHP